MVAIYVVWPILSTIRLSFFNWDGMTEPSFIGLANYVELFQTPTFYTALKNNLIWLVLFLLAPPMGLAVALYLNQAVAGIRIVKSLFFAPFVLSGVVVGLIFSWFYDPTFGLLALILGHGVPVLGDPRYATLRDRLRGAVAANRVLHDPVPDRPDVAERRADRGRAHGRRAWLVDAVARDPAATAADHVHGDRRHDHRRVAQFRSDLGDDAAAARSRVRPCSRITCTTRRSSTTASAIRRPWPSCCSRIMLVYIVYHLRRMLRTEQ